MTPPNEHSNPPKDFFDDASFKTLYGGVVVTWVATSAIADVWNNLDPKMLGFVVAIIVAMVGFFLSEQRNMKKLVIAPFNGLLIYLTIMGGTSFLPANVDGNQTATGTDTTEVVVTEPGEAQPVRRSAFLSDWNPNRDLIQKTNNLQEENVQLEVKTQQLQRVNQVYETKLDSTRQVIQTMQISPQVKDNLIKSLDVSQNMELINNGLNQ